MVETWTRASQTGDAATVLSLMTEDAVFMVPGREPFGREVFEAPAGTAIAAQIEGTNEIVEIQEFGDWAFTRNRLDSTVRPPPAAEPVRRSGYTLTLFRKEPGRWRLARDADLLTAAK